MQVTVNGRVRELPDRCSVTTLLEHFGADPARVAVERNQDVIPRQSWADCALTAGDEIEIVTFVGGG